MITHPAEAKRPIQSLGLPPPNLQESPAAMTGRNRVVALCFLSFWHRQKIPARIHKDRPVIINKEHVSRWGKVSQSPRPCNSYTKSHTARIHPYVGSSLGTWNCVGLVRVPSKTSPDAPPIR